MGASSLEMAAASMGRSIGPETLEPVNLKLHEYGRTMTVSNALDVFDAVRQLRLHVGEAIQNFDILVTPTMPTPAPPHGGVYCATHPSISVEEYMDADAAYYQFVGVFNVTGHLSVSLPLAQSASGLPIGAQIVGRFGDEATLVRVARDLEEAMPWQSRLPEIRAGRKIA